MSLVSLLFKEYRQKVLGLLLLHPEREFHVRDIARKTSTVAGTLHKELKLLAEAGVLKKRKQGNQVLYSANKNCIIYEEIASILRKTSGVVDVLKQALSPIEKEITVAFVFGSVAKGKEQDGSDIDVMIIGNISFFDAVKALHPSQISLGREINPKVYSNDDWNKEYVKNGAFFTDVMESPKLFIIGGEYDFRKFDRTLT